jgi:hypothetical protein
MNTIDRQVRYLSRLEKTLRSVRIMVVSRKDGTIKVKWGKKLDLLTVPTKEWGNILKDEFEAVIKKKADMVREVIMQIDCRMQQLELDLFGKEDKDGNERSVRPGGKQVQDSVGDGDTGAERTEDVCAGNDSGTGEPTDAPGAEGGR